MIRKKSTITLDWNWFDSASKTLVNLIKRSSFKPKSILAVARGGLILGTVLSHKLNLPLVLISAKRYNNTKAQKKTIISGTLGEIQYPLLVADDVSDRGTTLEDIIIKLNLKKENYEIATLHVKPWSEIRPRFCVDETSAWVCYPWNIE